jgi:hypothetical protein
MTAPLADEKAPTELGVGKQGFVKFGALLQFWGLTSLVDDETSTTFRLRRAELKASGEIIRETIAYKLMLDAAKVLESRNTEVPVEYADETAGEPASVTVPTPGDKLSVLQDFAITFLSDYADVSVGQFKNGLSYEGMTSSAKLLFPERAPVVRAYGDKRDVGISVEKGFDHFRYFAGVFNGTGLNLRDDNNQKDLALRLEVLPTKGLLFGAVGYTSLGQRDQATTKDRVEVDARLELSNFVVQAEYLRAWDGPSDARVMGHGYYGAVGYTFFERLQPVVRVGQLDLDLDANGEGGTDELTHLDLALNYYILGPEARLSASASVFAFDDEPTQTDIILLAQASF